MLFHKTVRYSSLLDHIAFFPKAATLPWPRWIGIDEYACRKGQKYDTVVVDLKGPTVFEMSPGKSAKSLSSLWDSHPGKGRIRGAVIDMFRAFLSGLKALGHRITIAVERFHVEGHLFDAVGEVRNLFLTGSGKGYHRRLLPRRGSV